MRLLFIVITELIDYDSSHIMLIASTAFHSTGHFRSIDSLPPCSTLLCRYPGDFSGNDAEEYDLLMKHLGMGEMMEQLRRGPGNLLDQEYCGARKGQQGIRG